MDHRTIIETARAQHGLITLDQAKEAGGSRRTIQALVDRGSWSRLRDGVFIVGAAQHTWEQRVLGAVMAAGPDAMASHRTAARLHGLVDRVGRIELLTDGYRRVRLPGVLTHRTIHLAAEDRTFVGPVASTSLARTLIDVSPGQSESTMGRWVDQSLLRNQLDIDALIRRTTELTIRGRPRPTSLMQALTVRTAGHDPGRSVFEARVIAAAAKRGLPELVRQHPVTRPDGRRAWIDLAHPASHVAVELDGWATHGVRSAFEPDRVRGNELLLLGWDLLRFSWGMTDDYICDTIDRAIDLGLALGPSRGRGRPAQSLSGR